MKRFEVIFADRANTDLRGIHSYIAEASQSYRVADRFLERIIARCEKIGDVPFGGRPRDDLMPGLRMVPFEKSTLIAYRVIDETVEITNVFHGGRNYEALYRDSRSRRMTSVPLFSPHASRDSEPAVCLRHQHRRHRPENTHRL